MDEKLYLILSKSVIFFCLDVFPLTLRFAGQPFFTPQGTLWIEECSSGPAWSLMMESQLPVPAHQTWKILDR